MTGTLEPAVGGYPGINTAQVGTYFIDSGYTLNRLIFIFSHIHQFVFGFRARI
jgi:hypothetical protein